MKKLIKLLTLGISLVIISCEGDKGDVGPAGQIGTKGDVGTVGIKGDTGPTGVKGDQGAAKVVYTSWKTVKLDKVYFRGSDLITFGNISTAEPTFTKEALEQGVVLTFWKINSKNYNSETSSYNLEEKVTSSNNVYTYYNIPGRTKILNSDYKDIQCYYDVSKLRENYFEPLIYVSKLDSDGLPIPELKNLTDDQYRVFAKDFPQYRHVIIYGSTKGRLASIDLNNYATVKEAFNLPD